MQRNCNYLGPTVVLKVWHTHAAHLPGDCGAAPDGQHAYCQPHVFFPHWSPDSCLSIGLSWFLTGCLPKDEEASMLVTSGVMLTHDQLIHPLSSAQQNVTKRSSHSSMLLPVILFLHNSLISNWQAAMQQQQPDLFCTVYWLWHRSPTATSNLAISLPFNNTD